MYSGGVLLEPAADLLRSAIFFETPEQIFARVFAELKPRTKIPDVHINSAGLPTRIASSAGMKRA